MFVYKPYNISMKSKSDFTRRNAQRLGLCSELKKKRQQPESRLLAWFLAQRVGFEPTVPLPVHLISSQGRYNHFDTTPCGHIITGAYGKSKINFEIRSF